MPCRVGKPQDEFDDACPGVVVDKVQPHDVTSARKRPAMTCMMSNAAAVCVCRYRVNSVWDNTSTSDVSQACAWTMRPPPWAASAMPNMSPAKQNQRMTSLPSCAGWQIYQPALLQEIDVAAGIAGLEDELALGKQLALAGLDQVFGVDILSIGPEVCLSRFKGRLALGSIPHRLPFEFGKLDHAYSRMSAGRQTESP